MEVRKQAPWNPQADSDNPLMKLGDMIDKATPVYDRFWRDNDSDILSRLDAASEKLKEKRSSAQKEAPDESSPNKQDRLDAEDPHPSRPVSISIDEYSEYPEKQLEGCLIQHPHGTYDTSDRPTQGDTPYSLQ